ncbi:alpha/beta hydrolase [Plantactinospora sp. KLBMP9567]|uniref:alpha/beta hydrolase n=1 Tax=Plantactinospora sp. KLBMP9567 TaxID=3085900 RepID=UPI002982AA89|nr:alpha/beta hydrolase [Plantactinospora sp. KLBMP9567]MDW5328035.1 alpha/beta hydrolase [Plantactinospora sp. KLBMP9567]
MQWKQCRILPAGGAVAMLASLIVAAAPVQASGAPAPQSISWAPCAEDASAQCGTFRVPVDWAHPEGPTIDLVVARRVATDPSARIGTLIFGPGGPGGPGRTLAINGGSDFTEDVRRRFDILSFDPRGWGQSSPIACSLDRANQLGPLLEAMSSQADFDNVVAQTRALADDCRARSGPVFDHMDTRQTVYDIDALRATVGDPQLTFYGGSYGTMMAHQYAEIFPDKVRAIVADSNLDHSLDGRNYAVTTAAAEQDAFNEFVAGCGSNPNCPLYGRDIRQFWTRLLDRAARGELLDADDPAAQIKPTNLIGYVVGELYHDPGVWPEIAAELVSLDEGRPSGRSVGFAPGVPGQPDVTFPFVQLPVWCQDWTRPASTYAEWTSLMAAIRAAAPDLVRPPAHSVCLGWPTAPTNPPHKLVARNTAKVLLVNSLHDPSTGYQWAQGMAAQYGNRAVLLTYEGWGHITHGRSPCIDSALHEYLISGQPPAPGTRCPAIAPSGT